uniref:Uncharacterized protein n=1 Tax=Arundo donax TaxID=35708 RepID=A0A0A8ZFU6_ARUDO
MLSKSTINIHFLIILVATMC